MASPVPRVDYHIAPGTADDLDSVMVVVEAAFGDRYGEAWTRSQCAGILPMKGIRLTIARVGHHPDIVGFSLTRQVADECELLLLAVVPEHHRCGIGRSLLDHFLDRAQANDVRKVHLEVRDGNPAVAMYRSAGFEQIGRRTRYYRGRDGSRHDALTFARKIQPKDRS